MFHISDCRHLRGLGQQRGNIRYPPSRDDGAREMFAKIRQEETRSDGPSIRKLDTFDDKDVDYSNMNTQVSNYFVIYLIIFHLLMNDLKFN